jgi:hypothetical protein
MEDAVLFTEAALNVQLSNMGEHLVTTDSLYVVDAVLNTNATNESGLVAGADIFTLYNSIKSQVITIGNNNFSNGDVYVSSVDISYGDHFDKSAIKVFVKFGRLFASGDCDLTGEYRAVFRAGGCGINFGTRPNTDAAREVSHRFQRGNCNTPLVRCGKRSIYYNLITYPDFYASPVDYWNRERYYRSTVGNNLCISELTQDAWYGRMDDFIANEFPYVGTGGRLITPYNSWLQTRIKPLSSTSNDAYINNLIQFGDCTFINDVGVIKVSF